MPPKRDGNIATFFQPKQEENEKSDADPAEKVPAAESAKQQDKGKGKRPSSGSPPADKKRNIKPTAVDTPTHYSSNNLPAGWVPKSPDKTKDKLNTVSLTVHKGDLFGGAPKNSLLIHACNTQGSWGAGIARAFRDRYPKAYVIYRNFCIKEHDPRSNPIPTGTALLIPPVDAGKSHWIGCLFTSAKYGKAKAKPEQIVKNTGPAMQMLLELVRLANEEGSREGVSEVRMCKINAGLFSVPWEKTAEALESIEAQEGWRTDVDVWEP